MLVKMARAKPATARPTWRVDRLRHGAVPLLLALDEDDRLVYVALAATPAGLAEHATRHHAVLRVETRARTKARTELREYLAGRRREFTIDVRPLGTDFEQRVWAALAEIPYGTTSSYAQLAEKVGERGGARAVGRANGRNPIPLVLPCHRVIGAGGELVGFGGGLPTKRWLLQLERERRPPPWSPRDDAARSPQQLGLFG